MALCMSTGRLKVYSLFWKRSFKLEQKCMTLLCGGWILVLNLLPQYFLADAPPGRNISCNVAIPRAYSQKKNQIRTSCMSTLNIFTTAAFKFWRASRLCFGFSVKNHRSPIKSGFRITSEIIKKGRGQAVAAVADWLRPA